MLIRNKHHNIYLQNCYNKYKNVNFGILQTFDFVASKKELYTIEASWIKILNPDLNLSNPLLTGGNHQTKKVYQYNLKTGKFIQEWTSPTEAADILKLCRYNISSAAAGNGKNKSAHGFLWSYDKVIKMKYTNNTGSNLIKKEVELYKNNNCIGTFKSLSDAARYLCKIISYKKDWKNLRTRLSESNKKGWRVCKEYTIKYK